MSGPGRPELIGPAKAVCERPRRGAGPLPCAGSVGERFPAAQQPLRGASFTYTVKGLTWGPPVADAGRYMPDVKSMGVNAIRTWGTDATTKPLLDTAAANGIKAIAGFWLQPGGGPGSGGCVNYLTDTAYKNDMLAEFPKWVETYKDHEGVLMWNVGNESVLGLQNCYSGDALEQQRDAYTTFVNEIAEKIHAVDPNHPVTSTDAWTGAWPYYKKNAPDLDLYAVNSYDAVRDIKNTWESGGYDEPYIVTEGGPAGEWEVPDDANGVSDEPATWRRPRATSGPGTASTGTRGRRSAPRCSTTGRSTTSAASGADTSGDNTLPVISGMAVDNASAVQAGKPFTFRASVSDPDGDALTHQVLANSKYIDNGGQLTEAAFTDRGDGTFEVTAPHRTGSASGRSTSSRPTGRATSASRRSPSRWCLRRPTG